MCGVVVCVCVCVCVHGPGIRYIMGIKYTHKYK